MNSKKIIIATFSLLLSALLMAGAINVCIDPLFQYHKPWFGLQANVIDERYQNAGIAKNFDFENVIIGNSMSENFIVSDIEDLFGGKAVKLTASGSYVLDWTYLLELLKERDSHPDNIIFNFDTSFFTSSSEATKHEMPLFLYDKNYLNDVEYLFNFTLMRKYSYKTLEANFDDTVSDYNTVFVWGNENDSSKEIALKNYYIDKEEQEKEKETTQKDNTLYTEKNLALLKQYFESMPDTNFVFFHAPFSVLYWKDVKEDGNLSVYKREYAKVFELFSQFDNVTVYFWDDPEMLKIISDLNNYKDSTHYGYLISKELVRRMDNRVGVLSKEKACWSKSLDTYFGYLEDFDYNSIY